MDCKWTNGVDNYGIVVLWRISLTAGNGLGCTYTIDCACISCTPIIFLATWRLPLHHCAELHVFVSLRPPYSYIQSKIWPCSMLSRRARPWVCSLVRCKDRSGHYDGLQIFTDSKRLRWSVLYHDQSFTHQPPVPITHLWPAWHCIVSLWQWQPVATCQSNRTKGTSVWNMTHLHQILYRDTQVLNSLGQNQ